MKKNSIKINYIYNVSYQILLILIPLITTPYISRVLGASVIGAYSYAESIATYFVLFATMGITYYGQREIAYLQDDREKRTKLFWETKIFTIIIVTIALLLYIGFCFLGAKPLLYYVLAINILNVAFDVTWLFQGMEDFGSITLVNAIFKALNVVYIFVFVKNSSDVVIYAVGLSGLTIIGNAILWLKLRKYIDKPCFKGINPFRNVRVIISLFIPTIAIQVYTVLDKTMLGIITADDAQNGYYDQALRLSRTALTLVTALGTVMVPRVGYHHSRKEDDIVRKLMYRGYNFVWFLGVPICFGLIGVAGNVVPWFYGNGYDEVVPLLGILSFLILAIGINNVTGIQYLIPTERQNVFTFTVIIGAVVNFVMNLLLIPVLQARGAAIASVIAETVIAITQLIIVRKEISICKVFACSWKYLVSGGIMYGILHLEQSYFVPSVFYTLVMILSGMAVYVIALWILRDEMLLFNGRILINKLRGNHQDE